MIKDFSTALRQDREKNIALSRLKKEFAVQRCVDVHQLDGASELFMAFPYALDLDEPCMIFCLDDLAGKPILGAVEAGFGRDGITWTCECSARAPHPADRQGASPAFSFFPHRYVFGPTAMTLLPPHAH